MAAQPQPFAAALAEALRIAYEDPGPGWFTPAALSADGLDAGAAARAPVPGANLPWRVLDHLRIGLELWRDVLDGRPMDPPAHGADDEWTPVRDPSDEAWADLRRRTLEANRAFAAAVAALSDTDMLEVDPAVGATRLEIALSMLAHTGYHAGELATLRTILEG